MKITFALYYTEKNFSSFASLLSSSWFEGRGNFLHLYFCIFLLSNIFSEIQILVKSIKKRIFHT